MSASTQEIFQVSIRKLFDLVSPSNIRQACYSVTEGSILYVLDDGDVVAVKIREEKPKVEAHPLITKVNSIHLCTDEKTDGVHHQNSQLVTLNKDNSLSLYQLSEDGGQVHARCIASCSKDNIQEAVTGVSLEENNIHIINTAGHHVYAVIGQYLLQVILDGTTTSSSPIQQVTKLQWNPSEDKVVYGRTENGLIFLLHSSGNIFTKKQLHNWMWSTHWKCRLTEYFGAIYPSFNRNELKSSGPSHVDITPDLQYLIIIFHKSKYGVLKISLNEYFELFSSHFHHAQGLSSTARQHSISEKDDATLDEDEVDTTHGRRSVNQIGAAGNRSWRNLLASTKELVNRKSRVTEKTESVWKVIEEREKLKNWFHNIHGLQPLSKQQPSAVTKRALQQDGQATTALKKRKISAEESQWSRSTTLNTEEENTSKSSYIFKVPKNFRDKSVGGVCISGSSVLVWYRSNEAAPGVGQKYGGVCIIDVATNSMNAHSFTECTVLAGSHQFNHPPLLISKSDIEVLACNAHQETLVNQLMIYKSASVAESLCLQNSWDHCSIPIHALEVGLRHRQLDTVAFYLKSRENVFHVRQPTASTASSPTAMQPTSPARTSDLIQLWLAVDLLMTSIRDNIKEPQSRQYSMQLLHLTLGYQTKLIQNAVEGLAVDLLMTSIRDNIKEPQSRQYSMQLLHLTLGYQTKLIQNAVEALGSRQHGVSLESTGPSEEELNESLRKLMAYVAELRLYLKECPRWLKADKEAVGEDATDGAVDISLPENLCPQGVTASWGGLTPQDLIKDAILNRTLPVLQAYLHKGDTTGSLPSEMSGLISRGLDVVLDALLVADLDTACGMLQNMGYNVNAELKKICLFTANNSLRDFLINHLSQMGEFNKEEEEAIAFVNQLGRLYACRSFEKAKSIALESDKGAWSEQSVPKIPVNTVAQEFLATSIVTGELVSSEAPNCENFNYADILLDWVKHWDQETRERILIEKLLSAKNKDTPIQFPISQNSLWNYLTTHSEWVHIEQWIESSLSNQQPSGPVGWNPALPKTLGHQVADQLQYCTTYLRERVLNELARRGVFSSAEFSNLRRLVYRLGANNLLFSKPSAIPVIQQEGGASNVQEFNQQFMEYCVKEKLPSVLYLFLDYYKLCQAENDVINMQLPFVNGQWLEMMLHFRWVARQIADPALMFQASLSNGRLLLRVAQPSVTALLEANRPIVALASLMYAPGTLSQAMTTMSSEEDKLWKALPISLKEALRPYPKLQAAIFSPHDSDGSGSPQDITVYQLLQGNVAFEPSKLFHWQSTNNTAPKSGKLTEMQHFSQPDLVCQFAYHEDFKFTYYLYQGRPSFAFVAFLASQLREDCTVSRRRISRAYYKAYTTALRHFTNHSIAVACVAFIEMLGRDSLPLRVDLQAANTVMKYDAEDMPSIRDKMSLEERLISDLMLSLKGSKSNAELIAEKLSTALTRKLQEDQILPYMWEASDTWVLAILYSRLHKLPLPSAFLEQCALYNQWLHFACFAQAHQYPKDQILELVKKFESATVKEHLQDAFENLQYGSGSDRARKKSQRELTRDVRSQFYLKMGVLRRSQSTGSHGSISESSDVSEDLNVSEDYGSLDESFTQADEPIDLDISKVDRDLFAIIFSCNSTAEPWKSLLAHSVLLWQPILALIASCYQDAHIVDCLAIWLLTSMSNQSAASKVTEHMPSLQWHSWTLLELREVITAAVQTGDVTLLVKGFFTFDPECTLNHLLSFCECFIVKKNFPLARKHLKEFHTDMLKCRRQESLKNIQDPNPGRIQGELEWCQETACQIVELMFAMCQTNWDIAKLLQLLSDRDFSLIVSRPEPNYNKLHKICQLLEDTTIQLDIMTLLKTKVIHFKKECQKVVEILQKEKMFAKAKEFSELCGLPRDQVVVYQLQCELAETKKSRVWLIVSGRIKFWRSCHSTFKKNQVQGRAAHQFFMSQVSDTATLTLQETVTLLTYAHQWLAKHVAAGSQSYEEEMKELQELEYKMWQWKLKAEVEKVESSNTYSSLFGDVDTSSNSSGKIKDAMFKSKGASEFLYLSSHHLDSSHTPKLTDKKEISALNSILHQLLEHGCIIQAHRLATQFQHPHQDLSIILTCIQLALGKVRPLGLGAEMQVLLRAKSGTPPRMSRRPSQVFETQRRPLMKTMSMLSMSSISMDPYDVDEEDEVLKTIQDLCQHCTGNKGCCERILNAYAIAQVLQRSYESIVTSPPFDILKAVFMCGSNERFTLGKTFIKSNGLKDTEVAGFLSGTVIASLQTRTGPRRKESAVARQALMPEITTDREEFGYMIRLCKDPAILGNRLLEEVNQLAGSENTQNKQVLTMQVELLIRAHDCHTLCCNTEGICNVLRVCRDCSNVLQQAGEFNHLARLLIGVGRYSEMTYIFDTLRTHQQIELLLKRGTKDDKLKVALLDYLKRCDPPDTETYSAVAVKFEMNREIGELVEKTAKENLKSLTKRAMDTNIELQNSLQAVLQDFTKAAEHYAKDNCLRHAERCIKQARLVALQLHLLPMRKKVVNLDTNAVAEFVTQHPKFYEAFIVSNAYRYQTEWSVSIYNNVIDQGDLTYFEEYRACMPASDSIFREVAMRFKRESSRGSQTTANMKTLLGHCQDVLMAYKIATELDFQDIARGLLEGEAGAYLRDVA
ncbi:spatacsin-like [Amphiura filiformis]|uniref:spatacsin-like n=1 Tax=Amphiura filiformis TaxID=82378 RepID=UPI003B214436